jgi:hypothetical protein
LDVNSLISGDFVSPWAGTISPTSVSVSSVSNESGGLNIDLSLGGRSSVNIGSNSILSLTGNLSALTPSAVDSFQIELFDAEFDSVFSNFAWSSFSGGSSVFSALSSNAAFSGNVVSINLNLGGLTGETVSFTFSDLTALAAIPEPNTIALLSLGVLVGAAAARSRTSVSQ